MVKPFVLRSTTEDEYKKLDFYSVGTLHRASTLPVTEQSAGAKNDTPLDLRNLPEDPILVAVRDALEEQKRLTPAELAERFKNMTYEQIEKLASDLM